MQVNSRRTQAERNAATRTALLAAARCAFADKGFAAAGTEDIAAAAGASRGALYHHFADKTALLDAVVAEIAVEISVAVEAEADAATSPLAALKRGAHAFLREALRPDRRRVYLIDAPAALGWSRWRAIDAASGMGGLRAGVAAAHPRADAEAVTVLISGALNEAALLLAEHSHGADLAARVEAAIDALIDGLFEAER
ncbi:MAG: TetR family transcriptional regulator [Hyphomonadaceae bacterium]|nr:TetR family transcriptional regulator [Hyphomonadaceae bacterium]